jgi:D-3-phosphoglycerate dehydrogenase
MLPKADFVSIHVPLTPHTRHFISKKEIEKMKDGVMLINCSRGGVVDEEALYEALVKGKVKAAALDVFAQEPAGNNRLLSLANVIATPHIGAQTWEAQSRTSLRIAEKIIAELEKLSS